jgi:ubiquinone biosynthesis protein UbiJ
LNQLFATTLETLLNQALRLDPTSLHALSKLSGKIIRIEISGMSFTLFIDNQGITVLSDYDGEVDVRIGGAPFTLLRLLLQNEITLSNNPEVTINGEIGTAQQLLSILKGLDIDWEEQLAQGLGDIPAHQLSTLFRQCQNYTRERINTLQLNMSEYLQEESGHLPGNAEIEVFLDAVDTLRNDVERLEQKVQRLESVENVNRL